MKKDIKDKRIRAENFPNIEAKLGKNGLRNYMQINIAKQLLQIFVLKKWKTPGPK